MKVRRCRLLGCQDGNYAVRSCLVWDRHATFQKAARNLWHAHGLNGIPPSFSTCFATSGEVEVPFPIKPKALKVLSKLSDLKTRKWQPSQFSGKQLCPRNESSQVHFPSYQHVFQGLWKFLQYPIQRSAIHNRWPIYQLLQVQPCWDFNNSII